MQIPDVRTLLLEVAAEIDGHRRALDLLAEKIRFLEREMYRRPPVRKAPSRRKSPPKADIIAFAAAHPKADYMEIGEAFETNTGRVSEALNPPPEKRPH